MPIFSPSTLLFVVLLAVTVIAFPVEITQRALDNTNTENGLTNCSSIDVGPPTECGQVGNTVMICSPSSNDTWVNDGFPHVIVWNSGHPFLAGASAVDIYLIFQQNYKYNLVRSWPSQPSYPRLLASHLTVCVDASWFPPNLITPLSDASNRTFRNFAIRIVPEGQPNGLDNTAVAPDFELYATSESFAVIDIAPSPSSSLLSTSLTISATSTASLALSTTTILSSALSTSVSSQPSSSILADWQIGLIAISGSAVAIAVAAAIFAYNIRRGLKRRKSVAGSTSARPMITSSQFDRPNLSQNPQSSPSIASTTPLVVSFEKQQGVKAGLQDPENSNDLAKVPSNPIPPAASAVISTTDAKLIADTFRRKLRRPEWVQEEEDEDEKERREAGERLLREELAEEGTSLRSVLQKRATVGVEDISKEGNQNDAE